MTVGSELPIVVSLRVMFEGEGRSLNWVVLRTTLVSAASLRTQSLGRLLSSLVIVDTFHLQGVEVCF